MPGAARPPRPSPTRRQFLARTLTWGLASSALATLHGSAAGQSSWRDRLPDADKQFLTTLARDVIAAARVQPGQGRPGSATNAADFPLIMPGGNYPAFWIRDFSMSLDCGLISAAKIRNHLFLLARKQNGNAERRLKHGLVIPPWSVPDHITFDGRAVFYPGTYASGDDQGDGSYGQLPPIDDHYEFVHIASRLFRMTRDPSFLNERIEAVPLIDRLIAAFQTPRTDSTTGLVLTDPTIRAVGFGFCDAIVLTGQLLFPSLLRWRAAGELAELCRQTGRRDVASRLLAVQRLIRRHLGPTFRGPERFGGWLKGATAIGQQADVWGTLFALWLDVLNAREAEAAARAVADAVRRGTILYQGAVRHVPTDLNANPASAWERTVGVKNNTYQNGAYWHTATGWLLAALGRREPGLAADVFAELIRHLREQDFRRGEGRQAPWECFGPGGYAQNGVYMTSVTVPLSCLQEP